LAMQLEPADPARAAERPKGNFRLAVKIALGFVALLWVIELLSLGLDLGVEVFGVRPRELAGLLGILFAPLVHAGFVHLLDNSLPLIVAGTAMLYLYPQSSLRVLPAIYLGPGVAVWLVGPSGSSHLGASGLVYGMVSYIFVAGLIRKDKRALAASMLGAFLYGAPVWGVLPIQYCVALRAQLPPAAELIGGARATALGRSDAPPPRRYSWEREADDAHEHDGT